VRLSRDTVLAGRYRLIEPLGEGGMGEVWLAVNSITGRPVALKCLRPALAADGESDARARFMLEAQAACAVEHPNVVEVLDFQEHPGEPPLIVMERLQGETLSARLSREHALSVVETVRILVKVVSAVGTAHSRGIVHRDLKPANIFLGAPPDESVKVLDFGIAKWMAGQPGGSFHTQTGSTLGTPCYMAPEQAIGDRRIDHRVDIWALGVILYECLSGTRPIEGENAAHVMVRLLSSGITPIDQLVPDLPEELAQLVRKMLSRERGSRPADLREVQRILSSLTPATAPEFGEPRLEVEPAPVLADGRSTSTAAPVAWAPTTEFDPSRTRGSRLARVLEQPRNRRWLLFLAGGSAAGFALSTLLTRGSDMRTRGVPAASERSATAPVPASDSAPRAPISVEASAPGSRPAVASGVQEPPPTKTGSTKSPRRRAPVQPAAAADPPPSAAPSTPEPPRVLAAGAACERSRDCASHLCVAFTCE
jgi:serine/threonine-protein kinase